jgi:hypothetical protein
MSAETDSRGAIVELNKAKTTICGVMQVPYLIGGSQCCQVVLWIHRSLEIILKGKFKSVAEVLPRITLV